MSSPSAHSELRLAALIVKRVRQGMSGLALIGFVAAIVDAIFGETTPWWVLIALCGTFAATIPVNANVKGPKGDLIIDLAYAGLGIILFTTAYASPLPIGQLACVIYAGVCLAHFTMSQRSDPATAGAR